MGNPITKPTSNVEQVFLKGSGRKFIYTPDEKIPIIEVDNFPTLGKLTALSFLEWVQQNPEGVISLPTGKTPEHFIKWTTHYLQNWHKQDVIKDLENNHIDPGRKPDLKKLTFVQIDEFYPINPNQANSFNYYVNKFYIKGFGLDRKKAMLMDSWTLGFTEQVNVEQVFPNGIVDLSLRTRQPKLELERKQKEVIEIIDEYCTQYESKIREKGGIGFFLGGIGPDGHIAFNVRGSDHFSTTRLTQTNYETQAAAAQDLGGIEVSRNHLVITIGLSTITFNKNVRAIIIAAGEAKARIVADSIQNEKDNQYPATILHGLPNARFYLTRGAAKLLQQRMLEDLNQKDKISADQIEKIIYDLAIKSGKRIEMISENELKSDPFSRMILKKENDRQEVLRSVRNSLVHKINSGVEPIENKIFMHTAPHHDDIMLGYFPYIYHLVRTPLNTHYFNYMTSGFNAVTNKYVHHLLEVLLRYIDSEDFIDMLKTGYFNPSDKIASDRDVFQYLDGIAAHSQIMQEEALARRLLRIIIFLFEEVSLKHLKDRINELINYFHTQYPGKKDLPYIQQMKGMIRELEADLLWGYLGFNSRSVNHLRLGFYKGDIFTEEPEIQRDVMPVLTLLEKIDPDIVTVALDPEGSGPDTHYKVMQTLTEALKIHQEKSGRTDIEVWGYRNVWYRFHPSEANIFVPVSLNSLTMIHSAFINCFGSQRDASFPSYEYDGPFSGLAQRIFTDQFQAMKACIGREFFYENNHPRLRGTRGLCFLKKMNLKEFYQASHELRKKIEA